jgi:hypothetical protein
MALFGLQNKEGYYMKKINVGVVGCGNISGIYFENLKKTFVNTHVYACADLDEIAAKSAAERWNISNILTFEQILDCEEIDIILNITTPQSHYDICKRSLLAGKHVYVEKPLSLSFEEGSKLVKIAEEKGLMLGCAPDTFLGSGIQTCRKLIDSGFIGEPIGTTAFSLFLSVVIMLTSIIQPGVFIVSASGYYEASQIIVGQRATDMEWYAARELQKYIYQITGQELPIKDENHKNDISSFVIGQSSTNNLIKTAVDNAIITIDNKEQGYTLKTVGNGNNKTLYIAGNDESGVLYGVYGLLEDHYNVGFYFGGDTLSDQKTAFTIPNLDEKNAPEQKIRGILPWTNFPQSATSYSMNDWESVIDTMSKMRMNLLNIHNYNGFSGTNETYHSFTYNDITQRVSTETANSGHAWGGPGWDVNKYMFGATDLFDDYNFGSDSTLYTDNLNNADTGTKGIKEFQQIIEYAHNRGVKMSLGLELDNAPQSIGVTALDPGLLDARADQIIKDYKNLDYLIIYRTEANYSDPAIAKAWNDMVIYVHNKIKIGAPNIKICVSGWGLSGDGISDLPDDIIVAPISYYSAGFESGVQYGNKEYWACPWTERDFNSSNWFYPTTMDLSQTMDSYKNNKSANMTGLFALTWRLTGPIDPKLSYIAKAPWDKNHKFNTSYDVYHEYAVDNYGTTVADGITNIINQNEPSEPAFECGGTPTLDGIYGADIKRPIDTMQTVDADIAIVDQSISVVTGSASYRLNLLKDRLVGVKSMYTLNSSYNTMQWGDFPGAFEPFAKSFINSVVDISSLGNIVSTQNRLIQQRYVSKLTELRNQQVVKSPLDVTASGTIGGAVISWTKDNDQSLIGYNVYRGGLKINNVIIPTNTTSFIDTYNGSAVYTVTAVRSDEIESIKSIPANLLAGTSDTKKPTVVVISPPQSVKKGQAFEIKASVIDTRDISALSAILHYRIPGDTTWTNVSMENRTKATFTAKVDVANISADGIEYYITASDGSNVSVYPSSAPSVASYCVVENNDISTTPLTPSNVHAEGSRLKWDKSNNAFEYRIYRSTQQNFTPSINNFVTYVSGDLYNYLDLKIGFDGKQLADTNYYRITATDINGNESASSNAISIGSSNSNNAIKPFESIDSILFDESNGPVKDPSGVVAYINNNSYIKFNSINFDNQIARKCIVKAAKDTSLCAQDSYIEVWVDGLDTATNGTMLGKVKIENTLGWDDFRDTKFGIAPISGLHDVYLKFSGNTSPEKPFLFNLKSMSFEVVSNAQNQMSITAFDSQFGVTVNNNAVTNIDNGDYLIFNALSFNENANTCFEAMVKRTVNNASGVSSIDIWVDGKSEQEGGKKLGKLQVTVGNDSFRKLSTDIQAVTGIHDLYLVFTSEQQSNLFDIMSFNLSTYSDAYEKMGATTYWENNGVQKYGDLVAYIDNNDYTMYKNVEFGSNTPQYFYTTVAKDPSSSPNSSIEVWIDGKDTASGGILIATAQVVNTVDWFTTKEIKAIVNGQFSGEHNLYLVFKGGSGYLFNVESFYFKLATATVDAFSQIEAESYAEQSGVQIVNNIVGFIENSDYIEFNNVDFGSGANIFNANVASDGSGGNIEVWIDGIDSVSGGTKIGSCSVENTGDWYTWVTKTCAISQTSGIHSVYLKFTGNGMLFNISWFQFENSSILNAFSQIEAESFDGQSGVQIAGNCVGYIENNDYIKFNN